MIGSEMKAETFSAPTSEIARSRSVAQSVLTRRVGEAYEQGSGGIGATTFGYSRTHEGRYGS